MIKRFLFHLLAKDQIKIAYEEMEERVRKKFLSQFFGFKYSSYLDREAYNNIWKPLYKEFIEPYI